MIDISKESLLENLKQIFTEKKKALKCNLSISALGENDCGCGETNPEDCDCEEVDEVTSSIDEPSELIKQQKRAERRTRALKNEDSKPPFAKPYKTLPKKSSDADAIKRVKLLAKSAKKIYTKEDTVDEAMLNSPFSKKSTLRSLMNMPVKPVTLGAEKREQNLVNDAGDKMNIVIDRSGKYHIKYEPKHGKGFHVAVNTGIGQEYMDDFVSGRIGPVDESVGDAGPLKQGQRVSFIHKPSKQQGYGHVVDKDGDHHIIQTDDKKRYHIHRSDVRPVKESVFGRSKGLTTVPYSGKKSTLGVETPKDETEKQRKERINKERTMTAYHNARMEQKVVPQPDKHTVQHNQGKGVHSQVSSHDTESDAQAHIKKLKSQGDKRDLLVQRKKQFSKVVKEVNEYKPKIVSQQEYERCKKYKASADGAYDELENVTCEAVYNSADDFKVAMTVVSDMEKNIKSLEKMMVSAKNLSPDDKLRFKNDIGNLKIKLNRLKQNEATDSLVNEENGYIAFYNGRQLEVHANTSYEAQQKAVALFKPKKSQAHMVHVKLSQKDGKDVVHIASESVEDTIDESGVALIQYQHDERQRYLRANRRKNKEKAKSDLEKIKAHNKKLRNDEDYEILPDDYIGEDAVDIFFDEETNEEYYIELDEKTLSEARFIIRVNSKGKRSRKLRCPKGKVVKSINGRKMCANQGGKAKLQKRLAIRKALRTKRSKGTGAKKRANIKRQRALRRRHSMGL